MELCQVDLRLRVHRPHVGVADIRVRSLKSNSKVTMTRANEADIIWTPVS